MKKTTDKVTQVLVTTSQAVDLCTAELKDQYGSAPQKAVDAWASPTCRA